MIIGLDTETERIAPSRMVPQLVCFSVSDGSASIVNHATEIEHLTELIDEPEITFTGLNAAFDWAVIGAIVGWSAVFDLYRANRIVCSGVREKLLDIAELGFARPKGVKDLMMYYYDIDVAKGEDTWRSRYGELLHTPMRDWPDDAISYARDDAAYHLAIHRAQEQRANNTPGVLADQYRQSRASFWLYLMSAWGLRTDLRYVDALEHATRSELAEVEQRLVSVGLVTPGRVTRTGKAVAPKRNTKAAKAQMLVIAGTAAKLTPSGQVAIDKQAIADVDDPDLQDYGYYTTLQSVISKDLPILRSGIDRPIHSRFDDLKETGRTGSSNPNVQNFRRLEGVRECFVPSRHGWVYIQCDYEQLELWSLAQVCKELLSFSAMGEALMAGRDPHLLVASQILNKPYEWCAEHKKDKEVDDARQAGKVFNFGKAGGLGNRALVAFAKATYGVIMTEDQARTMTEAWYRAFPEMRLYLRGCQLETQSGSCTVVHGISERHRANVSFTQAANTRFQGRGADIAKAAGFELARALYAMPSSPLYGYRLCNFVHDDYWVEGPESTSHEAALEMARILEDAAKPWLPDYPGIKAPPIIARRASKKARAIWENGRLIPWDD